MPRIAIVQTPGVRIEQWPETLDSIAEWISQAAAQQADIVLLPECVWPAYCIDSKEAYFAARGAGLPSGAEFLDRLAGGARRHSVAVCAGYIREDEDRLYNSASLISRQGDVIGTTDKCFLWDFDRRWFEAGRRIEPFDTEFGRVGMMICADARLPEIPATLAARGAELILQPTAWVSVGDPDDLWNPQPDFLIPTRARENGLPIASASKWGVEGDTTFVGSSLICDATGRVITRCGRRETQIACADVELAPPNPASISDQQRRTLLAKNPRLLRVLVFHPNATADMIDAAAREVGDDSPLLAIQPRAAAVPAVLAQAGERVLLTGPSAAPIILSGIPIGALPDRAAATFAPIRTLALRGVKVFVVFGDQAEPAGLRTRAAENRVFLIACSPASATVYDPHGGVVTACTWDDDAGSPEPANVLSASLDLSAAGQKQVAWRTDVIAGRDPGRYEF